MHFPSRKTGSARNFIDSKQVGILIWNLHGRHKDEIGEAKQHSEQTEQNDRKPDQIGVDSLRGAIHSGPRAGRTSRKAQNLPGMSLRSARSLSSHLWMPQ